MTDATKKRRARHVASDEAHAWARSLPLNNPNAKTVLRALALYVNGEGSCFVGIEQLSEDTDLSADTVRRRLVWLEQIGAIVRLPQWLDGNGRRNNEGKGKRTSDEIRLLLAADVDDIERAACGEGNAESSDNSSSETTAFSPSTQQGLNPDEKTVSPTLGVGQPSQWCEGLTSEPEPESSPQAPLPGGSVDIEGWKEFESDWAEPILRQQLAQQVWSALSAAERQLARSAARGYVAWRKAQRKPPNTLGAHLFLRERDAWDGFAKRDPGKPQSFGGVPTDSPEGLAIAAMYAVARVKPFESQRRIIYPGEITAQVTAFALAPERSQWVWIEDRQQLGAWSGFLSSHVHGARPQLLTTRGVGVDQRSGMYAPWPWPPRKDGSTGPPPGTLSDEEAAEFK